MGGENNLLMFLVYPKIKDPNKKGIIRKYLGKGIKVRDLIQLFGTEEAFNRVLFVEKCETPECIIELISNFLTIRLNRNAFSNRINKDNFKKQLKFYLNNFKDDEKAKEEIKKTLEKLKDLYKYDCFFKKIYRNLKENLLKDKKTEITFQILKEVLETNLRTYLENNKNDINENFYNMAMDILNTNTESLEIILEKLEKFKILFNELKKNCKDDEKRKLFVVRDGIYSFGVVFSKIIINRKHKKPVEVVN